MSKQDRNARFRASHPNYQAKYRKDHGAFVAPRAGDPWNDDDSKCVLCHRFPDPVLAEKLGRSFEAIEHRRTKLKERVGEVAQPPNCGTCRLATEAV